MSSPDADDASRSQDYSGDPDESDMAEVKHDAANKDGAESHQKTNKAAANAKDPSRPRRKKARRACMACQRAHLTCGDERPCERCIKRNLHEQCQDGVRKKAKYLHDAPDSALQPPIVGRLFPHANGHQQQPLPVALPPQPGYYTQAPSNTYYAQNQGQSAVPVSTQDGSPVSFPNAQTSIGPPFNQNNHNAIAGVANVPQGAPAVQQFGHEIFDPSEPGLFNFDVSGFKFGNQYGALEMGALTHMSSGAAELGAMDRMLNMDHNPGLFNQQMGYGENSVMSTTIGYDHSNGLAGDWRNHHSRHGSLQIQTPNNTPTHIALDNLRHDSLHGPHAFAIGQAPVSFSSPSPASTDVNGAHEADNNTIAGNNIFPHQGQHQGRHRSPQMNRMQQENRTQNTALQPIPPNVIRKRRRDTSWVYQRITKPYDYVGAFHRMTQVLVRRYPRHVIVKILSTIAEYRPIFISTMIHLSRDDLIHQEQGLQLSLIQIEDSFSEVGVPSVVCRRSGEVVWMNKEFQILTGWSREVLLGHEPNLNINTGATRDSQSATSTQANTTPVIAGQQDPVSNGSASNGSATNNPVLLVELLDTDSAMEYFEDFAKSAFLDSQATCRRRVRFLRYMTKKDMDQDQDSKTNGQNRNHQGHHQDSSVKLEGGPVHPENTMSKLSKDGVVDCMIQWHVKRDMFGMPMLVCMHVMPVLDTQPPRPT